MMKYIHIHQTIFRHLKALFVGLLCIFFFSQVRAQQDFINGFYMFNPMAFNPAIAGVNDQLVISGIAREQWTGINGAPSTQYIDVHSPVWAWFDRFDKPLDISYPTGFSSGFSIVNDKLGATNYFRLSVPLAVRIRLSESGLRFSMGVRTDLSNLSADYIQLRRTHTIDYNVLYNVPEYFVDFATGLYLYHDRWFAGVSMTNMRGKLLSDYGYHFVSHYFVTAGYAHPVNEDFTLKLTSLGTIVNKTPFSGTLTPALIFKNKIETGLTYRFQDMLGAFFSVKPIDNLTIGYWYEYPTGVKMNEVGGTHEIMLRLTFERFEKRIISPRYFW